jgi:hypothetical protein
VQGPQGRKLPGLAVFIHGTCRERWRWRARDVVKKSSMRESRKVRGEFDRSLTGKKARRVLEPGDDPGRPDGFELEFEDGSMLFISANRIEYQPADNNAEGA